jgi:plastocyanin
MRAVLIAGLCSVLVACGEDTPKPVVRRPPAVVRLDMSHNRFVPRRITVHVGQVVEWTNRDRVAHTVASQNPPVSSEAIRPGESYTYRPKRAGTFKYFCTIHFGQTGRLLVVR